ncbi:hypothetical protein WA158_000855 [Blastocystis sp. Blastoise]
MDNHQNFLTSGVHQGANDQERSQITDFSIEYIPLDHAIVLNPTALLGSTLHPTNEFAVLPGNQRTLPSVFSIMPPEISVHPRDYMDITGSLQISHMGIPEMSNLNQPSLPQQSSLPKDIQPRKMQNQVIIPMEYSNDNSSIKEDPSRASLYKLFEIQPPKRVRTAYNFFAQSCFDSLKKENNTHFSNTELMKICGEKWKCLKEEEKQIYIEKHKEDEERYKKEDKVYKEKFQQMGLTTIRDKKDQMSCIMTGIKKSDVRLFSYGMLSLYDYNMEHAIALLDSSVQFMRSIYTNNQSPQSPSLLSGTSVISSSYEPSTLSNGGTQTGTQTNTEKPFESNQENSSLSPFIDMDLSNSNRTPIHQEPLSIHDVHMTEVIHDNTVPVQEPIKSKTDKQYNGPSLRYTCLYEGCTKSFSTKGSLRIHMRSHNNVQKKYICQIPGCNKEFQSISGFNKHKRSHIQNQQYPCTAMNCNKVFKSKQGLQLHILNIHQSKKPYPCEYPNCNKSFSRRCDLHLHVMRIHTGQKPYKCLYLNCNLIIKMRAKWAKKRMRRLRRKRRKMRARAK